MNSVRSLAKWPAGGTILMTSVKNAANHLEIKRSVFRNLTSAHARDCIVSPTSVRGVLPSAAYLLHSGCSPDVNRDLPLPISRTGGFFSLSGISWNNPHIIPFPSGQFPFISPVTPVPVGVPLIGRVTDATLPSFWDIEKCDPLPNLPLSIEMPTLEHLKIEKQAARLIRIRRRKMKKHQYTKLKKKYGHIWEKNRQRRQMRRLKQFYIDNDTILARAKTLDPEQYVRHFIATAKRCQQEREEAASRAGKKIRTFLQLPKVPKAPRVPGAKPAKAGRKK